MFKLHPSFDNKILLLDLSLCRVLMENSQIPWIFLIPMKNNILQMHELSVQDIVQLALEIKTASVIMEECFNSDRINVAAIGNKTPQLHVHIVARKENDNLWPEVVWGGNHQILDDQELIARKTMLVNAFLKIY